MIKSFKMVMLLRCLITSPLMSMKFVGVRINVDLLQTSGDQTSIFFSSGHILPQRKCRRFRSLSFIRFQDRILNDIKANGVALYLEKIPCYARDIVLRNIGINHNFE